MAKSSIINISPRKVKAVVDKIKGKSLDQSLILLGLWSKKSAGTLRGTLLSAAANAKEKAGLKKEELKILWAEAQELLLIFSAIIKNS